MNREKEDFFVVTYRHDGIVVGVVFLPKFAP